MVLAPGSRLAQYEIVSAVGSGGMGVVYRARDTRLNREVALKVMAPHIASDPAMRTRFETEARAVASLTHPGILSIYELAVAEGVPFAVMERAGVIGFMLVIGLFVIGLTNDIDRLSGEGFEVR